MDIKSQLITIREKCPEVFVFLKETSCIKEVLQIGSTCNETTCDACDKCWILLLEVDSNK